MYWEADVICNFSLQLASLSGEWCLANVLFVDCRGNMHISLLSYCVLENSEPDVPEHWGWVQMLLERHFWKFDPNFWLGWKRDETISGPLSKAKPEQERTRVKRSWHEVKEERDTCKDKIWANKCPTEEETLFFITENKETLLHCHWILYNTRLKSCDHTASCQVTKISLYFNAWGLWVLSSFKVPYPLKLFSCLTIVSNVIFSHVDNVT